MCFLRFACNNTDSQCEPRLPVFRGKTSHYFLTEVCLMIKNCITAHTVSVCSQEKPDQSSGCTCYFCANTKTSTVRAACINRTVYFVWLSL